MSLNKVVRKFTKITPRFIFIPKTGKELPKTGVLTVLAEEE